MVEWFELLGNGAYGSGLESLANEKLFITYETEFVLYLFLYFVLKFCLAHGLRQLTRDTIINVSCLQMLLTRPNEKLCRCLELAIIPR